MRTNNNNNNNSNNNDVWRQVAVTTREAIGARATSWCNRWKNSTLLGQQQWPPTTTTTTTTTATTIGQQEEEEDNNKNNNNKRRRSSRDKRNCKLGNSKSSTKRETKKMEASNRRRRRRRSCTFFLPGQATTIVHYPISEATSSSSSISSLARKEVASGESEEEEKANELIIDLNPSNTTCIDNDPLKLVNCISKFDYLEQQERESEKKNEKCHQDEQQQQHIKNYITRRRRRSITGNTIYNHHSKHQNSHNSKNPIQGCERQRKQQQQQQQQLRKLNRCVEVKECDFRRDFKMMILVANDTPAEVRSRLDDDDDNDDDSKLSSSLTSGNSEEDEEKDFVISNGREKLVESKSISGQAETETHPTTTTTTALKATIHHQAQHINSNQAKSSSSNSEAQVYKCINHHFHHLQPTRRPKKHRKSCRENYQIRQILSNLINKETEGSISSQRITQPVVEVAATTTTTTKQFRQHHNKLIRFVELISYIIYILIFTSILIGDVIPKVSATNYWPLTRNAHKQQQQTQVASPAQQQSAGQEPRLASHQLMIGQHYNNFSSIVPYSIVQDSDYGSMQDELVDQLEEEQQQQQQQHNQNAINQVNQPDQQQQLVGQQYYNNHHHHQQQQQVQQQHESPSHALRSAMAFDDDSDTTIRSDTISTSRDEGALVNSKSRALLQALSLDSNRLMLPQMQQIKSRFNQGCVGGTKCQFFAFCWMSGGSLGASCGLLMTCCVTPSRQEIQPGFYGPVVNDPYCGRSTSKINRIVGGTDASFGQFPWQAFVQVGGSRCGGALISSRHVVTAGHCVARSQHSPSSIKVTLGDYILNSDIESIPHEVFSVVEVLLHPNFRFTPQADRYDVAVLELDRTASYKDNIKPICLPQKDAAFVGRVAYVAGWGALQAGSKLRPKVLQHVAVPVIENHVCESWHRRKGIDIRIYDEMMCAGYELGQRDACQGDSGGPLMLNQFGVWYLVGIVSAGYSCAKQYQPGIYHRVSSSSDWISSNIYQQGANK